MFNKSGNAELVEKLGDWFSYDKVIRNKYKTDQTSFVFRLQELWSLKGMLQKSVISLQWWDWWGNQLVNKTLKLNRPWVHVINNKIENQKTKSTIYVYQF